MPCKMPEGIVFLRPLLLEQRLGLPVTLLLPPVGLYRVPAVMPDLGRGTEPQLPAALLKLPANINVVSGYPKLHIKAVDCLQCRAQERHIATGDVLSFSIGKKNV